MPACCSPRSGGSSLAGSRRDGTLRLRDLRSDFLYARTFLTTSQSQWTLNMGIATLKRPVPDALERHHGRGADGRDADRL